MLHHKQFIGGLLGFVLCSGTASVAQSSTPLTTAFTYQGQLSLFGQAAEGDFDMRFRLWSLAAGGDPVGQILCASTVPVHEGRFSVSLDFGSEFIGNAGFLEVMVRPDIGQGCADKSGYTSLSPLQELTAAPNALFSKSSQNAAYATTAGNASMLAGSSASSFHNAALLTGTLPDSSLGVNVARTDRDNIFTGSVSMTNPSNTLAGNGAEIVGLNGAAINAGSIDRAAVNSQFQAMLPSPVSSWSGTPYSMLATVFGNSPVMSVGVTGTTACMGTVQGLLKVVDVSNPSAPVVQGAVFIAPYPGAMTVSGNYAYIVSFQGTTLTIVDITNRANPVVVGTSTAANRLVAVALSGTRLYALYDTQQKIFVFDVANPANPQLLGSYSSGIFPTDIAVCGSRLYVTDLAGSALNVYDISSPAPQLIGSGPTVLYPTAIAVSGGLAAVLSQQTQTLQVLDVSGPNPIDRGHTSVGTSPIAVSLLNSYAFVLSYDAFQMQVFDVAQAPSLIGSIDTGMYPVKVLAVGDNAYVASYTNSRMEIYTGGSQPAFGTLIANQYRGSGAALTGLNASNISTGTLAASTLSGVSGAGLTNLNASSITGTLPATALSGVNGSGLTNLNASNISTGTLDPSHLGSTVVTTDAAQTITGGKTLSGVVTFSRSDAPFMVNSTVKVASLNADLLDGLDSSVFMRTDTNSTVNGTPAFNGGTTGSTPPFSVDSTFKVTNLNADLLDNIDSASFMRTDVVSTVNAIPAFNGGTSGVSSPFTVDSTTKVSNLNADFLDGLDSTNFVRPDSASTFTAIPAFNGGSGTAAPFTVSSAFKVSSLNADLLDGLDSTNFVRSDSSTTINGTPVFNGGSATISPFYVMSNFKVTNLNADLLDGIDSASLMRTDIASTVNAIPAFNGGTSGLSAPFTVDSTFKVSSLNADLLDGHDGAEFALLAAANNAFSGSMSVGSTLTVTAATGSYATLAESALSAFASGGGAATLDLNPSGGAVQCGGPLSSTKLTSSTTLSVGAGTAPASPPPVLVMGGADLSSGGLGGYVRLGQSGSSFLLLDNNEIEAFTSAGANGTMSLNLDGGTVNCGGSLSVTGSISKGSGTFKIDHPLDPENKFLYHSFVESPDMMNIYNGTITTDSAGYAIVTLPSYFEALNDRFQYQLTIIDDGNGDDFFNAKVVRRIGIDAPNQFTIRTVHGGMQVSWQVTGIRKDAFAQAHRVQPEVEKSAEEKGKYLHPAELGKPLSKGLNARTAAAQTSGHD